MANIGVSNEAQNNAAHKYLRIRYCSHSAGKKIIISIEQMQN